MATTTIRLLVFGYGLGPAGELHPQTMARCLAAIRFSFEREVYHGDVVIIYVTVSYQDMGDKMRLLLINHGISPEHIVLNPRGVGTLGEIGVFLDGISPRDRIAVATSWYHLPRVKMLFRKFGRTLDWTVPARGHISWKADVGKEVWKYLNDLFNRHPLALYQRLRALKQK